MEKHYYKSNSSYNHSHIGRVECSTTSGSILDFRHEDL